MRGPRAHGRPPWWPANEAWPPSDFRRSHWRRRRGSVVRWVGLVFGSFVLMSMIGLATLISTFVRKTGLPADIRPAAAIGVVVWAAAIVAPIVFFLVMRRVGVPVGDIISASGQVAGGDFTVRVPENGPPFVRSVAAAF